jgi:phage tail sheath protein FI
MLKGFARLGVYGMAGAGAWEFGKQSYTGDTFYKQGKAWLPGPEDALHAIGSYLKSFVTSDNGPAPVGVYAQSAMDHARSARAAGFGGSTTETLPGKTADDLGLITARIDASSIAEMTRPSGTQDVRVVNQQPPNVTVHAPISVTGVSDPQAAAKAAVDQLGSAVKNAVDTQFSD